MKKVLLAIFNSEDETMLDVLFNVFKKQEQFELIKSTSTNDILQFGNIEINPKCRIVKQNDICIELTNYEFDILYLLARHPGRVFSKKQIYEQVWNMPCLGAENNVVSLIYRIRKKIEPNPAKPVYILTVWGIGYKFSDVSDV